MNEAFEIQREKINTAADDFDARDYVDEKGDELTHAFAFKSKGFGTGGEMTQVQAKLQEHFAQSALQILATWYLSEGQQLPLLPFSTSL